MSFTNSAFAGSQLVRPSVRSPNYQAGSTGWSINRDGTVELSNGTFRGNVAATTISGATITGSTIQTAPPGSQRIVIDPSGNGTIYFYPTPGGTGPSVTEVAAMVSNATGNPVTSGPFSPTVGATLVAIASGGNSFSSTATFALTDTQGGSWGVPKVLANQSSPGGAGGGGGVAIFTRVVASGTAMTVTNTVSGPDPNAAGLRIFQVTGTSIAVGASNKGTASTGSINPTALTTTANGSVMFVGTSQWAGGNHTLSSADLSAFTFYQNTHQDGGAGYKLCGSVGSQSFQESSSDGSGGWFWVVLEITGTVGNDFSYINAPAQNSVGVNSGNGGGATQTKVWAQPSTLVEGYYTTAGVEAGGVQSYDASSSQLKYLSGGTTGGYIIVQSNQAALSFFNGGVLSAQATKVTLDEPNGSHFEVNNGNTSWNSAGGGSLTASSGSQININGGSVSITGSGINIGTNTSTPVGIGINGATLNLVSSTITLNNITGSTGTTLVMSGRQLFFLTSSSRFKKDIQPESSITLDQIAELQPSTYFDQHQIDCNDGSENGLKRCLGLIAEDAATTSLGDFLVNYEDGQPFSVSPYALAVVALQGVLLLRDQLNGGGSSGHLSR